MGEYSELIRVTVAEAARRLGVKEQAIRKRISRGTLPHDKDEDGRVYVYLDPIRASEGYSNDTRSDTKSNVTVEGLLDAKDETIAEMREQLAFLRSELERKDTLLMTLMQRVPELEPAKESSSDAPESPVTASEEERKDQVPPEPETTESQPWWRRIFR